MMTYTTQERAYMAVVWKKNNEIFLHKATLYSTLVEFYIDTMTLKRTLTLYLNKVYYNFHILVSNNKIFISDESFRFTVAFLWSHSICHLCHPIIPPLSKCKLLNRAVIVTWRDLASRIGYASYHYDDYICKQKYSVMSPNFCNDDVSATVYILDYSGSQTCYDNLDHRFHIQPAMKSFKA